MNANDLLYAAGNPRAPYAAIPAESAYAELDREHSRRLAELARVRGELFDVRADLRTAKAQVWVLTAALGAVAVAAIVTISVFLLG
jgi:hypothetical protein